MARAKVAAQPVAVRETGDHPGWCTKSRRKIGKCHRYSEYDQRPTATKGRLASTRVTGKPGAAKSAPTTASAASTATTVKRPSYRAASPTSTVNARTATAPTPTTRAACHTI